MNFFRLNITESHQDSLGAILAYQAIPNKLGTNKLGMVLQIYILYFGACQQRSNASIGAMPPLFSPTGLSVS